MNKIATEAVEQLQKYTTPFGVCWYLINLFFRLGLHQFAPRIYNDDMKEFAVRR